MKKNVLQIRSHFTNNGPGSQSLTISNLLRERGYNVVFCSAGGDMDEKIKNQGFNHLKSNSLMRLKRNTI